MHGVVIDDPISMPQLRAGVDLSRQDGAAGTVVLEVRLQGRVVFGVVVAPVGEHRGAGTSAERPARAHTHRSRCALAPRRLQTLRPTHRHPPSWQLLVCECWYVAQRSVQTSR